MLDIHDVGITYCNVGLSECKSNETFSVFFLKKAFGRNIE